MIAFTIPAPGRGCKQNTRGHWRTTAKDTKSLREATKLAALGQPKLKGKVSIHYVWHIGDTLLDRAAKSYRPQDCQNAVGALKGATDGIVDAGIIPDDKAKFLLCPTCEIVKGEKGKASYVEVHIRNTYPEDVVWAGNNTANFASEEPDFSESNQRIRDLIVNGSGVEL